MTRRRQALAIGVLAGFAVLQGARAENRGDAAMVKAAPWATLSQRDRGASGHWGDFRVVFSRTLRPTSGTASRAWVLDQTFTSGGVVETHLRAQSSTCPGLDALMAELPSLALLGSYKAAAPPVPEEPLQTLQSVDDDLAAASDRFKVSFYGEGAMGEWTRRLFKLPIRCWRDLD